MEDRSFGKYGCYVDDCDGEGCVLDGYEGMTVSDCNVAGELALVGKCRDDCPHWKPMVAHTDSQTVTTQDFKDYTLTYKSDDATKQAVFDAVLNFFKDMEAFSGESICQCDAPQIEAPNLLAKLADEIFCFDVDWKDD